MTAHDPLELAGLSRGAALRHSVVVVLCFTSALMGAHVWYYTHARGDSSDDIVAVWMLPNLAFAVVACGLSVFVAMAENWSPQCLALHKNRIGRQLLWGMAGAVLAYAALLAWLWGEWCVRCALWHFGVGGGLAADASSSFHGTWNGLSVSATLTIPAATAVAEEVAFRGLLLPRLRRITGRWRSAVVICALLYGMFDMPLGLCYVGGTIAVSIALCVVFIRSRSLVAAATAHALYGVALDVFGSWWLVGE